jgi:hypothetical protein
VTSNRESGFALSKGAVDYRAVGGLLLPQSQNDALFSPCWSVASTPAKVNEAAACEPADLAFDQQIGWASIWFAFAFVATWLFETTLSLLQ